jgi:hypothetical protein
MERQNAITFSPEEPPFMPWAAEKFKTVKPGYGLRATPDSEDPILNCLPPGVPRIMSMELPFQIFQTAEHIAMTFEWSLVHRTIYTNGTIPDGYFVNHYLTDPDSFFIITDIPNGLKHFVRVALKTDNDGDFDTGNVRYKARERYSFGASDPLGIWGSPGA